MADAFVRPAIDKLLSILGQKLLQELSVVTGFRHDFQSICIELNNIKDFLDDAKEKRKQADSKSLTSWLRKLQEFLDEAVDMMEDCEGRKFRNPVSRYRMGRKLKMLKNRLTQIHESGKYVNHVATLDAMNPRAEAFNAYSEDRRTKSSALLKQSIHVGMAKNIEEITNWIFKDLSVIAIVGTGGMGKTLLLQHVFNTQRVLERFDHLVWLAVSQKFVVNQLLVELGTQIKLPENQMKLADLSSEMLRDKIHLHLRGKRVLFVLDDVWDRYALDKIGLPRDSRTILIITTRDQSVADTMQASRTLTMAYLSEDDSWKLFCMYAFANCVDCNPPDELKTVAKEIVKKCCRLPLAVKTIGAYMANVKRIIMNGNRLWSVWTWMQT